MNKIKISRKKINIFGIGLMITFSILMFYLEYWISNNPNLSHTQEILIALVMIIGFSCSIVIGFCLFVYILSGLFLLVISFSEFIKKYIEIF